MQKPYLHNSKLKEKIKKKTYQTSNTDIKNIVDINILLNRVKIEKKNQRKEKIIFFCFITTVLILFGSFISIIK
tara:strand:- start:1536 stop:1757 length:222 start_codon:yes stop_codon:yes gene_type:complete